MSAWELGVSAVASAFSHAVAALSIGTCFYRPWVAKRVWAAGAVCSVIPDLDVVGFRFGIRYGDFWGHRGITHSLVFAALLTGMVLLVCFRRGAPGLGRLPLSAYLFLATARHGVLDAMTNGGLGVAFFSPFENGRYFLLKRPFWFRQYLSHASSVDRDISSSKVNSSGYGFRRDYLR